MRIALITLALTALIFVGSIVYSLMGNNDTLLTPNTSSSQAGNDASLTLETLKYQIKNEERINELMKKVDALSTSQGISIATSSGTTDSGSTMSGNVLPLSGKFLARVMPTFDFSLVPNKGIYDLILLNNATEYSTYIDAKQGITAIALKMNYDILLKNMKALSSDIYTVNETKTFPFRSFYLNPPKTDTIVRLVIEIEGQAIALEIPKTKFNNFKTLMLKN